MLPPLTPGITPEELSLQETDRAVLTAVVHLAEEAGKAVYPLVLPTNNPMYAIATAARDLGATEVVLGAAQKSSADLQLEQFAIAWGMAMAEERGGRSLTIRIVGSGEVVGYEL